jgi:hypothetical protein
MKQKFTSKIFNHKNIANIVSRLDVYLYDISHHTTTLTKLCMLCACPGNVVQSIYGHGMRGGGGGGGEEVKRSRIMSVSSTSVSRIGGIATCRWLQRRR